MDFLKKLEHLKIQLEDIKRATDSFHDNHVIGTGGFGNVYIGELSTSKGRNMVAFKRLERKYGHGDVEFLKEIMMLSRYTHENLICLLGFCSEEDERILVYEYAPHGSLDHHLKDAALTWRKRIKICLAAAKGLNYLHDPNGTQQRVLHCDIKSANILLDENWNAKVSDFGLSKIGPANQQHTLVITNAVGTPGYCDPLYMETYSLTKESDVYSFGVVLFEVLCGRLCFQYTNHKFQILVPVWKQSYEEKRLDEIICQDLRQQINSSSLESYSEIAYQCLKKSREERPTMSDVVKKLEIALEFQETYEELKQPKGYEDIIKAAIPPLMYRSMEELKMLLYKGVLLNEGKTWFSINEDEEHYEMISVADCLIRDVTGDQKYLYSSEYKSRFAMGSYQSYDGKFKTHIRPQFLSPLTTYTVNLVFKFTHKNVARPIYVALKYKLEGHTKSSISYLADEGEDEWLVAELYQFTSDRRTVDLKIQFEGSDEHLQSLVVEGIEFRPLEKVEHDMSEDEKADMQPISDSDTYWDTKLPDDYEEIIKWSKDGVQWSTKKELYYVLCNGFEINNGEEWFSLAKNGKKCYMLPARTVLKKHGYWSWHYLLTSRFGEVASCQYRRFSIVCNIKPEILSRQTRYASYLVYKLPETHSRFEGVVKVMDKGLLSENYREIVSRYICFVSPQTPVIGRNVDQNAHNPLNRPRKSLPRLRKDGWMEVPVWEFETGTYRQRISMDVTLSDMPDNNIYGLIVQGIEFKPI